MRATSSLAGMVLMVGLMASGLQGQHLVMPSSSVIPAASINLDLGQDNNGNTTVDLKAEHLAQPSNLSPAKSVYVVWVQADNQPPERKGQLKVDHDLNEELKFVTPEQHFQLFITAEDNASVSSPTGVEVVRGSVARGQ